MLLLLTLLLILFLDQVMESHRTSLNLSRGLWATLLGALVGAFAPKGLALLIALYRWHVSGSPDIASNWAIDLDELMEYPAVGCAAVCACAGWATYAPSGTHRFVVSLGFIFLVSLMSWYVLSWTALMPFYKGMEHSVFYPNELIAMIGPPIVAAALLTAFRIRRAPKSGESTLSTRNFMA